MIKFLLPLVLLASNANASDINVNSNISLKGKKEVVSLTPGSYDVEAMVKSKSVELLIGGQTVVFKKGSNSVWPKNKEGQIYIPAKDSKQSVDLNASYSDKVKSIGSIQSTQQFCTVLVYGQQCGGNPIGGISCWPVTTTRPGWQNIQYRTDVRTESLYAEMLMASKAVATLTHLRNYEQRVVINEGFCF